MWHIMSRVASFSGQPLSAWKGSPTRTDGPPGLVLNTTSVPAMPTGRMGAPLRRATSVAPSNAGSRPLKTDSQEWDHLLLDELRHRLLELRQSPSVVDALVRHSNAFGNVVPVLRLVQAHLSRKHLTRQLVVFHHVPHSRTGANTRDDRLHRRLHCQQ